MQRRVVIAGGGVAGLEAVLALRALVGDRDRLQIDLFSPRPDFVYRANAVGRPFDLAEIVRYDLVELMQRTGARFHLDGIVSVDEVAGHATTAHGEVVGFDYLVAAQGVERVSAVSGATTFWGGDDRDAARHFRDLIEGRIDSLALTAPGTESWDLPLYELALLAESKLSAERKSQARLVIVTPEEKPLRVFGVSVSDSVAALLATRRIEIVLATHAVAYDGRHLSTVPGEGLPVEAVISLPRLSGKLIQGLSHDEHGFVPVDDHCRVMHSDRLFAVGDGTSFPVKQGGIATQQADMAAAAIAAELGFAAEPPSFDPILRAVLWTGEEKLYLEGRLRGGHGENSRVSHEPLWPGADEAKIVGHHLSPFLAGLA